MEKVMENCLFCVLADFGWKAIAAWDFASCKSVDALTEFLTGRWAVEFLHDWYGCYALSRCVSHNILLCKQLLPVLCLSLHYFVFRDL